MSKQKTYHEPCQCGECPRRGSWRDRPWTKAEWLEWWTHHYPEWPLRKRCIYAIGDLVNQYREWVNHHEWRKPLDWRPGQPVKLHELRPKGKKMFPDEAVRIQRELLAAMRGRLDG